jgi:hypothetical protein
MKCAAELMMMRTAAILEHQLEEERKDEACRQAHLQAVENTIAFCENVIAPKLEAKAININENISYQFKAKLYNNRLNNTHFWLLKEDGIKYADGTPSFYPDHSNTYDYETFITYLNNFCFDIRKYSLRYKSYGCGWCNGELLEIIAQPCNS